MNQRIPIVLTLLLPIGAMSVGGAAADDRDQDRDQDHDNKATIVCSGMIGGGSSVTNLKGRVIVPDHTSCTLSFVNTSKGVTVGKGANLVIDAYTEPSTIGGDIIADRCGSVLLKGNVTVDGDLEITSCTGSGQSGFQGPDIAINGNFRCESNRGGCLAWLGKVEKDVRIEDNRSAIASDISLVDIGGELRCKGNSPQPTHLRGPNWADKGDGKGQCDGFITATTSIATPVTPAASCAALATLPSSGFPVPNTVITSAVDTPAAGSLPRRCIVNGYVNQHLSPADNCVYKNAFQVQLPLPANWNGKFVAVGGGGTEGSVPTATGSASGTVANGYAVATQNGGHNNTDLDAPTCDGGFGNNNQFYLDPLATITNATQSVQTTTLTAKYLINQYYGNGPARSYWIGCSTGGRQGMSMMQNYPWFFDGIIAGAPVYNLQAIGLTETWGVEQILNVYNSNPSLPPLQFLPQPAPQPPGPVLNPAFPAADQSLVETATLQACDALDGVADGVVDNLPACQRKFDPATATYTSGGITYPLQCAGAKNATCLSPAQIQAIKNINRGPRVRTPAGRVAEDPVDNMTEGYVYDGGWFATTGTPSRKIGSPTGVPGDFALGVGSFGYGYLSPAQPTYYALDFNFGSDLKMLSKNAPLVTAATSLNIDRFVKYGHKAIWYHGVSDPGPPSLGTFKYYNEMADRYGGLETAQKFSRFYPVPGMGHCSGGPATDNFDMIAAMTNWVENGVAPGPVVASGSNFTAARYQVGFVSGPPINAPTTRSRPLCPYPQQARFTGSTHVVDGMTVASNPADLASASNYACIKPQ